MRDLRIRHTCMMFSMNKSHNKYKIKSQDGSLRNQLDFIRKMWDEDLYRRVLIVFYNNSEDEEMYEKKTVKTYCVHLVI